MSLGPAEVAKIAHLARLAIRDEDVPAYARNLSAILELVAQMNAADTAGVAPMAHPLDMTQRLRPDAVTEPDQRRHRGDAGPLTGEPIVLMQIFRA